MFNSDLREESLADLRKIEYEYNEIREAVLYSAQRLYSKKQSANNLLTEIEVFVNKIANTPKEMQAELSEIQYALKNFAKELQHLEIERKKLIVAENSGVAIATAGAGVAMLGPTAAMAVATTFGHASTGTAIATLSGAAAQNAALAWLGGGALSAGGGGMVTGKALLALAGPVGWFVCGGALLTSAYILSSKNKKGAEQAEKCRQDIVEGITEIKAKKVEIRHITVEINNLYWALNDEFIDLLKQHIADYSILTDQQKYRLGYFVNSAKALAALLSKKV